MAGKLAIVLRDDLEPWQIANVSVFLASGVASRHPDLVGEDYTDADGQGYAPMFGIPAQVLSADAATLARCHRRALGRDLPLAVYIEDMFATMDDEANRAAVSAREGGALPLVGVATYGPAKDVDRAFDRARRHQ